MAENENVENSEKILENHLHQQYAENDNSRTSVFTSFIVGIIALFGSYGYVFVNTNKPDCWKFDTLEFLLMSTVTIGILFFLAILALYLGYSLRRDQIIVYNIREKRYNNDAKMEKIFGELYSPFGKKYCNFLPDFYNLFYWLFFSSEIFIFFTVVIKMCEFKDNKPWVCNCKNILFFIVSIGFLLKLRCCYYKKYKEACKSF